MADSKLSTGQVLSRSFDVTTDTLKVSGSLTTPTGQDTMANSAPVVIASDQTAVPVSAASLPLPTGAATSANQATANGKLTDIEIWLNDIDGYVSATMDVPNSQITSQRYKTIVDEASASITYVGRALPATLTSAASWQISKFELTGNVLEEQTADGDLAFDNIWDNRAALSYS